MIGKRFRWFSPLVIMAVLAFMLPAQAGLASASSSVPTPVIYPDGATSTNGDGFVVRFSDTAGGDPIYYTTDGSDPRTSSSATLYTQYVNAMHSETVQAAAHDPVAGWSGVAAAIFSISGVTGNSSSIGGLPSPTIYPNGDGGAFPSAVSVTIGDTAGGDPIYYTTDDSNPETSSTRTLYTGTFTVSQSETVEASVYDNELGWYGPSLDTFHINGSSSVQAPTIDPAGGTFTTAPKVSIDGLFGGETAYYTTDGSDPTTSSTAIPYTGLGVLTVSQSETFKVAIHDPEAGWSSVASATFTVNSGAPVITPDGGSFTTAQSVSISGVPSGYIVLYTTDGNSPEAENYNTLIEYTGPFTVSQSETVNAAYKDQSNNWSSVASATFTINSSATPATSNTAPGVTTTSLPVGQKPISFTVGRNSYTAGGQSFAMDAPPFIANGRLLVPVRYLANALGARTDWDADTRTVAVSTSASNIRIVIGSTALTVNGQAQAMDQAPVIKDGRTYLPARYVAEALGYDVSWDASSRTVTVSQGN